MSQDELGEAIGMAGRTLRGWENGETTPTAGRMNKLVSYMQTRGIAVEDAIKAAAVGSPPHAGIRAALDADSQLAAGDRRRILRILDEAGEL